MQDFTRRTLLKGGTALAAAGALTGPALLDFAKALAQVRSGKIKDSKTVIGLLACAAFGLGARRGKRRS